MNTKLWKNAHAYNAHAVIQKQCAYDLANLFSGNEPVSSIIDVGCGTGFASRAFMEKYPNAQYTLCDISPDMVNFARYELSRGGRNDQLGELCDISADKPLDNPLNEFPFSLQNPPPKVNFLVCDADSYAFKDNFDLCISNLSVQWFSDFEGFIRKISKRAKYITFSTLTKGSFREFNDRLAQNIPSEKYKTVDEIVKICRASVLNVEFLEKTYIQTFESLYKAALHFKEIGVPGECCLKNAFAFLKNNSPVNLEYKVLIAKSRL
ncbi:MAG: methyltransferase domain-containing protein [Holosporales bacterium]|jgi:SAM-dependent methyltransferase|nr:methyltransferase domain-containing protein [Holosporales bacterium]